MWKWIDLKPAKPDLAQRLNAIDCALDLAEYARAEALIRDALARYRANLDLLCAYIDLYIKLGNMRRVISLLKYAIKHHPNEYSLYCELGLHLSNMGKFRASAKAYKSAIDLKPDSNCYHLLDAVTGKQPARPTEKYIRGLFDYFAATYEDSMLKKLAYQAPQKLTEFIFNKHNARAFSSVLDLGCGTGLFGQQLLKQFKIAHLAGVDLSAKMLEKCKAKNIYHALHNQDLIDYLQSAEPGFAAIVSCDVFNYFGDLEQIFAHSYRLLQPGGVLAFSVERLRWGNFKLSFTGRYQHSLRYINSLYKKYLFSKMYRQTIDLRQEAGKMVAGYLVLLQK